MNMCKSPIIILFYMDDAPTKCDYCDLYTLKNGACWNSKCKEYRKVQF